MKPEMSDALDVLPSHGADLLCAARTRSLLASGRWVLPLLFCACSLNQEGLGAQPTGRDGGTEVQGSGGVGPGRDAAGSGGALSTGGNPDGDAADASVVGGAGGATGTLIVRGTGGAAGMGGLAIDGGSAGMTGTGGSSATGGTSTAIVSSGGATGVAGATSTGGVATAGGASGTAGAPAGGGRSGTGGFSGAGGASGMGGVTGTGGAMRTGGASGRGGATGRGGAGGTGDNTTCVLGAFSAPELLTGLGLEGRDLWGPSLSADGLTLYFAASTSFVEDDIYVATRPDRGTQFSAALSLDSVNTTSADGSPAISRDGLTLYFYSTRPGGVGGRDLWTASRHQPQGSFGAASLLASVNGAADDNLQWIAADELTLIFSSERSGESDLYVAKRNGRNADFSRPTSLGGVNGMTTREDRAALSNDGLTIYFASDRMGGLGDKDIWVGTRANADGNFGSFSSLQAINSSQRDIDVALAADETEIVFSSNRGAGRFQLYRSLRSCQ